jgi:transcription elongation factor GreA
MEKIPMTDRGYTLVEEELAILKNKERPAVIQAISEAREHGDLSENAEYHAAREKQSFIEGRILELEDMVSRAEIIDVKSLSGNVVKFGATVSLIDEETEKQLHYQIVGEIEADVKANRIAILSPMGRALIGKSLGDSVEVNTPSGTKSYEITKVEFI